MNSVLLVKYKIMYLEILHVLHYSRKQHHRSGNYCEDNLCLAMVWLIYSQTSGKVYGGVSYRLVNFWN